MVDASLPEVPEGLPPASRDVLNHILEHLDRPEATIET